MQRASERFRLLARGRAVLTDAGDIDIDRELVPARWDLWSRAMDAAAAHTLLADMAVTAVVAVVSAPWLTHHPTFGPGIWALQAALVAPLVWRRRHPVAVFTVVALVAVVQWIVGVEMVADVALLASLYTVAAHRPAIVGLGAAAVVETGAVMASFRWDLDGSWVRSLLFLSGLVAVAFLAGTNVRSRRGHVATLVERAERLERERDQQALIAAAAERTRIAREMHDIVAHSLAVIVTLADGAGAKVHSEPARAAAAIGNVSEIGRQALGDTRRLLGILRSGDAADGLSPQPGIAQIDGLVAQVRATGLDASLVTVGRPRPLPPGAELTVFRIVQEAITNTLKHSVAATAVAVTLDYGRDELHIAVRDDGRTAVRSGPDRTSSRRDGHGLAGMRERAALYRGEVSATASAQGWVVQARLPISPPAGSAVGPVVATGSGR